MGLNAGIQTLQARSSSISSEMTGYSSGLGPVVRVEEQHILGMVCQSLKSGPRGQGTESSSAALVM